MIAAVILISDYAGQNWHNFPISSCPIQSINASTQCGISQTGVLKKCRRARILGGFAAACMFECQFDLAILQG